MKILKLEKKISKRVIDESYKVLKSGGLVIAPTDTVYGALVDSTNKKAVEKLIAFKERPAGKPISIFVSDIEMLKEYVQVEKKQNETLKTMLPGAFTIILKSRKKVNSFLESETGTLGVRYIDYPFIIDLVTVYGHPVTATSANLSGQGSSYEIQSLLNSLSQKKREMIDLVIDGGKLTQNKPSTVIDLTTPEIKVIRAGDSEFSNLHSHYSKITNSPEETKKIARDMLQKMLHATSYTLQKPLIFILEGDLGVGKTIFVKGIGEHLGITDIISPTFVVYYEYNITRYKLQATSSKLIHVDLYNLERNEEFKHLGLEKYLAPGNIMCIEWGEKSGSILDLLKEKGEIIFVKMRYVDHKTREITTDQSSIK